MTHRHSLLAGLLTLSLATGAQALMRAPVLPGSGSSTVVMPPTTPPGTIPPPTAPSTPYITARGPTSITVGWLDQSLYEDTNTLLRLGPDNVWRTVATLGAFSGLKEVVDAGPLTPDTRYCYVVVAASGVGSNSSPQECAYTTDGTNRQVGRAQLRLVTANFANAETSDAVSVRLNSAVSQYVPYGNQTWLDLPLKDFARGTNYVYDLSLKKIGQLSDINMISIEKTGGDAWCLQEVQLIINGSPIFDQTFTGLPGQCYWLDDEAPYRNVVTFTLGQLRTPGWKTFNVAYKPPYITNEEILERIESMVGSLIHGTGAYWGKREGPEYVESNTLDPNRLHVDLDLAGSKDGFEASIDVDFNLTLSGGCNPDHSISLNIDMTDFKVKVDASWLANLLGVFDCSGYGCVEQEAEDEVRAAWNPQHISVNSADVCVDGSTATFQFDGYGNIWLS